MRGMLFDIAKTACKDKDASGDLIVDAGTPRVGARIVAPDRTAMLSFEPLSGAEFSPDREYRYVLWRKLSLHGPSIMFVGLNPSTADEVSDDHTVTRMLGFAREIGCSDVYVTNLFGFRASDPRRMRRRADPIGDANNYWISKYRVKADICVACWGNGGRFRGRDDEVLGILGQVHCLGKTKRGCPRHPLYLRKGTEIELFSP